MTHPPKWLAILLFGLAAFGVAYLLDGTRHTYDAVALVVGFVAVAHHLIYSRSNTFREGFTDVSIDDIPVEDIEETLKNLNFDPATYGSVLRGGEAFSSFFKHTPAFLTVPQKLDGIKLQDISNAQGIVSESMTSWVLKKARDDTGSSESVAKFTACMLVAVDPAALQTVAPVHLLRAPGNGTDKHVAKVTVSSKTINGVISVNFVLSHTSENLGAVGAENGTNVTVAVTLDPSNWDKTPVLLAADVDASSTEKVSIKLRAVKLLSTPDAAEQVQESETLNIPFTGGNAVLDPAYKKLVLGKVDGEDTSWDVRLFAFLLFKNHVLTGPELARVFEHYNQRYHLFLEGPPEQGPGGCPYPLALCENEACADIDDWADPNNIVWKYPRCHEAIDEYCSVAENSQNAPACFCWNENDDKYNSVECKLWRAFIKKDENMYKDAILQNLSEDDVKALKTRYKLVENEKCEEKKIEPHCEAKEKKEEPASSSDKKCDTGIKNYYENKGNGDGDEDEHVSEVKNYYSRRNRGGHGHSHEHDHDHTNDDGDVHNHYHAHGRGRGGHFGMEDQKAHTHGNAAHGPIGVRAGFEHGLYDNMRWRNNAADDSRISPVVSPSFDRWDNVHTHGHQEHDGQGGHGWWRGFRSWFS